ncbi:MAG: PIN domain-containing protein [Ralstonia sp.]|jgi:hypothetical protein
MDERIHAQIVAGEITALTLDTSIFDRAGLAMEAGLLAQLSQFRDSDIRLVIASTVANEVRRHLAENAEKATGALQNALRDTGRHQALPAAVQQQVAEAVDAASMETRNRACQRFDDWVARVGATVLNEAQFASIAEVMRRYEAAEPPFGASGNKKHEFPDAVALSTLEGWATTNGTKILAVTQDNDWRRYGAQSRRLVVVDDLADALAGLQRLAEANEVADRFAVSLEDGDPLELGKELLASLQRHDGSIEFNVEADSQFSFAEEGVDVAFERIELGDPRDARANFETVSYGDGEAVIKVVASVTTAIDVHFSFERWDSVDREYMSMGSATISRTEEIEFEALVTVAIDVPPGEMTIESVEILPTVHRLNFGEIEPDWMSDPDNYDSREED